ncbi:hypothetical protein K3757_05275 [Sulfitobacter sp. S223]|uniref:hypothetical protein n=1 Tax=Sulfitobacter sp. S223 TaxID=2867023 RepID=UPI0021A6B93E|nr:hypothetical protein [Sulfitobacter sp. S223]UWR27352.1 hypothetical protein K3757_05275 [Sulfitobacter sp. S223]
MRLDHEIFTMSFAQARDIGIDYRDYEKVDCLPTGMPLTAIAGVWGNYVNIRCLFEDGDGNRYLRIIHRWGDAGYIVKELGIDAKDIQVGQVFRL